MKRNLKYEVKRNVMNIQEYKDYLVQWIRDWFAKNGPDCKAVIGISGGKDSTVVAALCCEALSNDRVLGVLMPNGVQADEDDSFAVIAFLGIEYFRLNIRSAYSAILDGLDYNGINPSKQTTLNLAPRLRMATLYAISQSKNGRVVGTGNASEIFAGYFTRYGDGACDMNPIAKLTKEEVVEIGLLLGLPENLVKKAPSDGLTGKTDDEVFERSGYSYADIYSYIKTGTSGDSRKDMILRDVQERNKFKLGLGETPDKKVD